MNTLEQWAATVCADLDLDPGSADTKTVLDLARDVAHGVARPAAPLTAYLVGVAVGRGLSLPDAAARVQALAAAWPSKAAGSGGSGGSAGDEAAPRPSDGQRGAHQ